MTAYYNEHDAEKAAWIRELIRQHVVAPGDVDERSIADVRPDDLRGYRQCHFFAGIAVWSYALRLAEWPDDKAAWTGSCPCPSFSCAGKGEGFDDPRHLWPVWYPLIRECRPRILFGEQADAAVRFGWLDLVCGDMEAAEYAIAAAVLGAHSVGAGHKRQRLYFCADSEQVRCHERIAGNGRSEKTAWIQSGQVVDRHCAGGQSISSRLEGFSGDVRDWRGPGWLDPLTARSVAAAGATRGFWGDCDWWYARDGKYRPIEPGLFPLAHGATNRVLKLRGYGDAIVAEVAKVFIEAATEGDRELAWRG
jgi:DNA (cytosine-5)-methyltransferase 1